MSNYDDTNTGTLFRNKRQTSDRSPTHTGKINIEGKWYWASAWVKESGPQSKNPGEKFFSLAFTEMEDQPKAKAPADYHPDEDIPF